MKTYMLLLFSSAYAAAHGPGGYIAVDDGLAHTITKTMYYTTVQRDESVHARAEGKGPLTAMASIFSWPVQGIKSEPNEAGAAQLTKTTPSSPLPKSGQHRRHNEAPLSKMATLFSWPSTSVKSASNNQADTSQLVKVTPTPIPLESGQHPRGIKGHEPTISQIPVTGTPIVFNKPKSRFIHRAFVLPSNSRNRRGAHLFNLKLILPRSPGYISVYISDNLAAPFCQNIPEEMREDAKDSKLDGSRRFYDLELGIGVGLSKIPVREDYAVKFCRSVKTGQKSPQTPEKAEVDPEKTATPKHKAKVTAAFTTEAASGSSKVSGTSFPNVKSSHVESADEPSTRAKATPKVTAAGSAEDFEKSKDSGTAFAKAKSSHIESATGGVTKSKAKTKATAAVPTKDTSDILEEAKAASTKVKSPDIESRTEGVTPAKTTAKPTTTESVEDTSDVPKIMQQVSSLSKSLVIGSTTQGIAKSAKSISTGTTTLENESLEGGNTFASSTNIGLSSSQTSDSIPHMTSADKAMPKKRPTDSNASNTVQSEGTIQATPGTSKMPSSAEISNSILGSSLILDDKTHSPTLEATVSKASADDEDTLSAQVVSSVTTSAKASPILTNSVLPTTDSPPKTTDLASFKAQRLRPEEEVPSLTVSSINSWYDSINSYLRTAKPSEEGAPAVTNVSTMQATATLRTPTASMTTLPSIEKRDDAPLLTVASMNSWYNSINDYLKTAPAKGATEAIAAYPSSNAAVRRANVFSIWERVKAAGKPPAVVVRRKVDRPEVEEVDEDETNAPSPEDIEELEIVHTADEKLDVPEAEQEPPVEEPPVEEDDSAANEQDENIADPETTPEDEFTAPDTDPAADSDPSPTSGESETPAPKHTSPVDLDLPPLELLKTEQPTLSPSSTPDEAIDDAEETEVTTKPGPTATEEPKSTTTNEDEEPAPTSTGEAETDAEGGAEPTHTDTTHGKGTKPTSISTPTPPHTLVWDPSCTAPVPLDPSSAPPAPPDDADDTSFPPSTINPDTPGFSDTKPQSKSKGCWTLRPVDTTSDSNITAHDSLSTAWGKIKDKEIVWTVMLGWTMLGLEVFIGGWEFVRGVRGDAEVGRRVVGLWVR